MPSLVPDVSPRPRSGRRPFVGRGGELDALRGHLGRPGLIVVTGDPGIGKTRLAEEFAAVAETSGAAVHWGHCWEGDGAPAFWPWIQILRGLARDVPAAVHAAVGDLEGRLAGASEAGPMDAATIDTAPSRFRLFDAVTTVLAGVAATRPLVLVLEDLHWADTPSVVLLQFLVRHAHGAPLLVIATYRDVELEKAHALRAPLRNLLRHGDAMPLSGLAPDDVARYVAATLGDERARALATRLHRETEGHPFFLVEMVRLLEASTAAALAGIPDGIRELIARRLRQRSSDCQRLLEVAAVVGRDFSLSLLRRLPALAGADVLALIGEALDARLITVTADRDRYRFGHALVREALYADLVLAERIALHREIGTAIEAAAGDDAPIAVLAHHFREAAADGDAARAVRYGILAGERASRALAHEEAVAHYERTLHVLERQEPIDEARRCPLLITLGLARVRLGDPAAAEATFLRAASLARELGLPEELARAALGVGEVERHSDRVVPLLEEALAALDTGDSVLRARLLSRLAVALYWARPEARKRALSDEAVAMARRLGYVPTLAYSLSSRIAALSGPDDVEERLAASREMVELAAQCDNAEFAMIGHGWTIAESLALGDVHQARIAIAAFSELATTARHPYFDWWLSAIRTMEAILDGRLAEAETLAEACFARGQRTVAVDATHVFAGHRYALCMESERHEELEPLVHTVVAQFPNIPSGHAALALLHADRGRFDAAIAEMDRLAPDRFRVLPRNPEWLTSIAVLAQTSALTPGAPHATTLYDLLLPYRGRNIVAGMGVVYAGSAAHFLGILAAALGRWDAAEEHLTEALAAHERLGATMLAAYTRYELASLALARRGRGDDQRAAALADAARRDAERCGMRRLLRLLDTLPFAATPAVTTERPPDTRRALFRKEGDYWRLAWDASEFRLRDRVGLRYLAALIADPAVERLAVDLVRAGGRSSEGDAPPVVPTAIPRELGRPRQLTNAEATLDHQAEHAYRERLRELRDVIADARGRNDLGRIAAAERESDAITREIARSLGLGNRNRDSRSPIERARISATRAIRAAIDLIREHDPSFGRHLTVTVKTGTFCAYVPDPETNVSWQL